MVWRHGENPYAYIHSKVAVRDNESVWIGSEIEVFLASSTWRCRKSHWGVLVEDESVATMVLNHLVFDENEARSHITPVAASDAPNGWSMPASDAIVGNTAPSIQGDFEATLLVCPDNCIDDLVDMLDGAEEEILLSLQYLDMDWSWDGEKTRFSRPSKRRSTRC